MKSYGPRKPQRQSTKRITTTHLSGGAMPKEQNQETTLTHCTIQTIRNPSIPLIPQENCQNITLINDSPTTRIDLEIKSMRNNVETNKHTGSIMQSQQQTYTDEKISTPASEMTSSSLSSLLSNSTSISTSHSTNSILSFMYRERSDYAFLNGSSTMKRCTKDTKQQKLQSPESGPEVEKSKAEQTDGSTCATITQTHCKMVEEDPYQGWNWRGEHRKDTQLPKARQVPGRNHSKWQTTIAPLASMETLSDISSISSLNVKVNCNEGGAESLREWEQLQQQMANGGMVGIMEGSTSSGCYIFESQLHTPKAILRTPKFSENLSKCTEDNRCLDEYKKIDRIIVKHRP